MPPLSKERFEFAVGSVSLLAVAAALWMLWSPILGIGLLGWDTYPLIETARVDGPAGLLRLFGVELMDGRYPLGRFYRPLVHLSFALDGSLWGLAARGYRATDFCILALGAGAAWLLARRLFGAGPALAAGLIYAAHPVHFAIMLAPARRAESLAVLFTHLALAAQPATGGAAWRRWSAATCCLLALASKESGALATAMVLALAFVCANGPGVAARGVAALQSAWPSLALFTAFMVARTAVLRGLGGSAETSLLGNLAAAPVTGLDYLGGLVSPRFGGAALALGFIAIWAFVYYFARPGPAADADANKAPGRRTMIAFLGIWAALAAIVTASSGIRQGWYALQFLPPLALAAGLALRCILEPVGNPTDTLRILGVKLAATVIVAGSALGLLYPRAPMWEGLREAAAEQQAFLDRFDAAIVADGERVLRMRGMPTGTLVRVESDLAQTVHQLVAYSMASYARLRFPDRHIVVGELGRDDALADSDAPRVVLLGR
jgi:hypothetical protein